MLAVLLACCLLLMMLVLFVSAVIAVMFHVDRAHSPGTKRVFLLVYLRHVYFGRTVCIVCHLLLLFPSGRPCLSLSRSLALQILD